MSKISIEKIIIHNLAPFTNNLTLTFDENTITVLSAINGKGKTTLMSYITDAFYEIAKIGFPNEFEGNENQLYRISSSLYILDKTRIAFVLIRFRYNEEILDYVYCVQSGQTIPKTALSDYEHYISNESSINWNAIRSKLDSQGFYKGVKHNASSRKLDSKASKDIFNSNVITYFPAYRNELPAWLNDTYSKQHQEFSRAIKYAGYLPHPIEVASNLHNLTNWMLDCVLDDKMNYETQTFLPLNKVLHKTLKNKGFTDQTRLIIGNRFNSTTRITVGDKSQHLQYPNLYNMSSGELALLGIFGEIIKQGDGKPVTQGIVLIDEIDKNLHIKMQKEALPDLLEMFPDVQFIVSSHAPFFGLGLATNEQTKQRTKIIDLDTDGIETPIENTEIYEECYNLMLTENEKYKNAYESLKNSNTDVILCEGITDVKHLRNAIDKLGIQDFDHIDFIDAGGDKELKKLLETYKKIPNSRKIIGLFDRDNQEIIQEIENNEQLYQDYGNNVYAMCIPCISNENQQISIEHYYGDFAKTETNGKRLFFGKEFNSTGLSIDQRYRTQLAGKHLKNKIQINGVIDNDVFKATESVNIALSKNDFAEFVQSVANGTNQDQFDFTVFNNIFDRIKSILSLSAQEQSTTN